MTVRSERMRLYLSDLPRNLSENRFPFFGLRSTKAAG